MFSGEVLRVQMTSTHRSPVISFLNIFVAILQAALHYLLTFLLTEHIIFAVVSFFNIEAIV
jgi:hypothetical protein